MNECDEVKATVYRIMKSDLLIAAISLIDRIEQDMQREWEILFGPNGMASFKRLIFRLVIDDENFDVIFIEQPVGKAIQHFLDRRLCVIGNDKDEEALLFILTLRCHTVATESHLIAGCKQVERNLPRFVTQCKGT